MRASTRIRWFKNLPVGPVLLWTCLWANLNTGFWNIQPPSSVDDWLLLIRALLPFVVLPIAGIAVLCRRQVYGALASPSRLLFLYGTVAAVATVFSPHPEFSYYWSVAFLATILAAWAFQDQRAPVESLRMLLHVTWVATFAVAAIIGYQARNSVFGAYSTAYGAVMADTNGFSRSSGVARWAAAPGLVCLVRAFHTRRVRLIAIYLAVATVAFYIVYRMQSRGAVFGSAAALVFILLVSGRMRRYALPFAVVAMVVIMLVETPGLLSKRVDEYLKRGQTREEFYSMTGRTRAYEHGLVAFQDAPLLGRGQWADRLTIGEHVHDSYLQALLNGGVLGFAPYLASWVAGWVLFFRVHKRSAYLSPKDRICLLEAGSVMMFFTVRAIPETTTASFSVDLLVMVAVYVYLEMIWTTLRQPHESRLRSPLSLSLRLPLVATSAATRFRVSHARNRSHFI